VALPVLLSGEVINATVIASAAAYKETIMDADVIRQQAAEWIVVEEEGWPGVNECGAIFAPDRGMRFEIANEEWPMAGSC
jgi:hypothetical protein